MKLSIKRRIQIGFGAALLILVVVAAASYRSIGELVRARESVGRSRDTIEALSNIFLDVQSAETGQRGYVITGDGRYLDPYDAARTAIGGHLRDLEMLVTNSQDLQPSTEMLQGLISAKLNELNRTIELRRTQGFDAAAHEVDTHLGKNLMDQIRELIADMEAQQRRSLGQEENYVRDYAQNAILIIAIGMVLAFTIVPLSNILIQREVVRRESVEEALRRSKEEAERASRFKDQFLSTMSHELRTPLNAVLGFSDLLKEQRYGALNERQRRYIDHIHTGGEHLLKLINDILDLSKIEAGRMEIFLEDVTVADVFADVANSLRPLAEIKHQEVAQTAEPSTAVRADITRLKQILMNLMANAIKFTPGGGRIELIAERIDSSVKISIRDNGPGIPVAQQEKIFEGFYRLPGSAKSIEGTGLGLAISRQLVGLHGSKLGLESRPGEGSCFHFTLPLVRRFQPEGRTANDAGAKAKKPGRILVVEDDPVSADLIQSHLASSGYEALICSESQLAFDLAVELQPQAITLDILMSPLTGWDLLVKLRDSKQTCEIPIIVVTIVDQRSLGTTLGADEYLVKPVDKASLIAAIDRCLRNERRSSPPGRVLVIEDDAKTREVIGELLTQERYQVAYAVDGQQARDKIAEAVPEFVVLDLILPKVSGFELLAEWRASPRTADLPIFIVTSKDLTAEEESYLRAHAELLVQKQRNWKDVLLLQINRIVGRRAAVQADREQTRRPSISPAERS